MATVLIGPTEVDGAISRVVSNGKTAFVETWAGVRGWVRGGTTFASLAKCFPADPETCAAFGIPAEDSGRGAWERAAGVGTPA